MRLSGERGDAIKAHHKVRGGRPPEYDHYLWILEVIRTADVDGMPPNKAALVRHLQEWCSSVDNEHEPSESALYEFVSPIYDHLSDQGWRPRNARKA